MAAGSHMMKLLGVVNGNVELQVNDLEIPIRIILKNAVVVKNLGPNILIGEPGKMDNDIITLPKQKLIQLRNIHGNIVRLPYRSRMGPPPKH